MVGKKITLATLVFCFAFNGHAKNSDHTLVPTNVVTADIQAGIENYIEEEAARGGGYFKFSSDGKEYQFQLVRVHTEYLANLGPKRHFACVDLVNTDGDVYDVDFFLHGDPGKMTVTETTLHKLNGIPYYAWEQNSDGTWERVSIQGASPKLLGVIHEKDEFDFIYRIKLPAFKENARLWIPYPKKDSFQDVTLTSIHPSFKYQVLHEKEHGNQILYFELTPDASKKTIDVRYHVTRREKSAYTPLEPDWEKNIQANRLIPTDGQFKKIAEEVVKGKKGALVQARALYDHVLDHMRYIKHGNGWGEGNAVYACDAGKGNCTDFHSYFISLARTVGIPARFAIGAAIPSERNDGGTDGYHCWAEFYAQGKWWPVDISEADKYTSLSTYYFGHNPANRIEFSRGRDLVVDPGPTSGPINFLADPLLEVGGKPAKATRQFLFIRKEA